VDRAPDRATPAPKVLIISPVRNEAAHVERVIDAVARQARPPDLWLVVDDGSDDGTLELLREAAPLIPFMRVVQTPPGYTTATADRLAAAAAPRAFNWGLAQVDRADYDFIGKLDGDTELRPDYLRRLLAEFDQDPKLGVGGGIRVERDGDGWRDLKVPREHVPGALKLYRRDCFTAIGGVQERLGWDGIDETYARMHGFTVRSFPELVTVHHRDWGTADGRVRGLVRYGRSAYIMRHSVTWILLRSGKVAMTRPVGLSGCAFLYGYFTAMLRSVPRVEDPRFVRAVRLEQRKRLARLVGRAT
jgi:glycosyltransferase involved in cell wall biosynthesis